MGMLEEKHLNMLQKKKKKNRSMKGNMNGSRPYSAKR